MKTIDRMTEKSVESFKQVQIIIMQKQLYVLHTYNP